MSFTQSFDAVDWARAFVEHVAANPAIPNDEATMIGWFANAIMRGYDEHARRFGEDFGRWKPARTWSTRGSCRTPHHGRWDSRHKFFLFYDLRLADAEGLATDSECATGRDRDCTWRRWVGLPRLSV